MSTFIVNQPAEATPFDNTTNGFTSDNTQAAIEESKNVSQPLDADLTAIAAQSGTGILTRTGTNTWTTRDISGTSPITITNGDGVSGNPTISHANSGVAANTYGSDTQTPIISVNAQGHITGVSLVNTKPALLNYYNVIGTNNITTTSGTFSVMSGLTVTPVAGTYYAILTCSLTSNVSGVNNNSEICITINGSVVNDSIKKAGINMSGISLASAAINSAATTSTIVSLNGSQTVTGMWRRSEGSTTHTCGNRHLFLIRIA